MPSPSPTPAVTLGTLNPKNVLSGWSTPRLLRVARATAAGAALLTGIVATGTFDTSGVNATPPVIAEQWVAAERASVAMSQVDLLGTQRVADALTEGSAQDDLAQDFNTSALAAARGMAGSAPHTAASGDSTVAEMARGSSLALTGMERAVAAAANGDENDARALLEEARSASYAAASGASTVGRNHAQDLNAGTRSGLVGVLGALTTLLLGGICVWLAVRTRRIINIPLTVATVITLGLAFVSLNPDTLSFSFEERTTAVHSESSALNRLYQARADQYALAMGAEANFTDTSSAVSSALNRVGDRRYTDAWREIYDQHEQVVAAGSLEASLSVLASSDAQFQGLTAALNQEIEQQLEDARSSVGTPAAITSGVALLLGLIAAALAWTGLSQRVRDYR